MNVKELFEHLEFLLMETEDLPQPLIETEIWLEGHGKNGKLMADRISIEDGKIWINTD